MFLFDDEAFELQHVTRKLIFWRSHLHAEFFNHVNHCPLSDVKIIFLQSVFASRMGIRCEHCVPNGSVLFLLQLKNLSIVLDIKIRLIHYLTFTEESSLVSPDRHRCSFFHVHLIPVLSPDSPALELLAWPSLQEKGLLLCRFSQT